MDPRHRDRVAFMRICSGRFTREMEVWHPRSKRRVRLAPPLRLFGQEREVVEEAYAGDVVGLINPGLFAIGDTVSEKEIGDVSAAAAVPARAFRASAARPGRSVQAVPQGVDPDRGRGRDPALLPGHECPAGADPGGGRRPPVRRGAVSAPGGVQRRDDSGAAHVLRCAIGSRAIRPRLPPSVTARGRMRAEDRDGRPVILFNTSWDLRYAEENTTGVTFSDLASAKWPPNLPAPSPAAARGRGRSAAQRAEQSLGPPVESPGCYHPAVMSHESPRSQ